MFCANREGMVIAQQAHGLEDSPLLRPIQVGRRLGESEIGTTAPAVSLADDLPARWCAAMNITCSVSLRCSASVNPCTISTGGYAE